MTSHHQGQQSQLELALREIVAAEILHSSSNISIALVTYCSKGGGTKWMSAEISGANDFRCNIWFNVPHNQLAFLLEARFSVPKIAEILGVSVRTVRRRMVRRRLSEYHLSIHM